MANAKQQFIEYAGYKFPAGTSRQEMDAYVAYYGTKEAPRDYANDVANEEFGSTRDAKPPKGLHPTNEKSSGEVTRSLPRSIALRTLGQAPWVAGMFAGGAAGAALKSAPWLLRVPAAVAAAYGGAAAGRGGELGIHAAAGVPLPEDIPADIAYEGLVQGALPELTGQVVGSGVRAYGRRLEAAGTPRPLTMRPSTAQRVTKRNPNIVAEAEAMGLPRGNPKNPAGTRVVEQQRQASNKQFGDLLKQADASGKKYTLGALAKPFIAEKEAMLKRPLKKAERTQLLADVRDLANELLGEVRAHGTTTTQRVTWTPTEMQDIKMAAQSKNLARYNTVGRNSRLTPGMTLGLADRSRTLLEEIPGVADANRGLSKLRDVGRVWSEAEYADKFKQSNVPILPPMPGGMPYAAKFGLFQNLMPSMTPQTALSVGRSAQGARAQAISRGVPYGIVMLADLLKEIPEYQPDAYEEEP